MQSVSSGIWTRVAVSISYDDNHYTTGTFIKKRTVVLGPAVLMTSHWWWAEEPAYKCMRIAYINLGQSIVRELGSELSLEWLLMNQGYVSYTDKNLLFYSYHTSLFGVEKVRKVINSRYDVIIWTFQALLVMQQERKKFHYFLRHRSQLISYSFGCYKVVKTFV